MKRNLVQMREVVLAEINKWESLARFGGKTKTFGGMTTEDTIESAREISETCASLVLVMNRTNDIKAFLKILKERKERVVAELTEDGISVCVGTSSFTQAKRRYMVRKKARAYAYSVVLSKTDDSTPEPSYEDTMKCLDIAENYTHCDLSRLGKAERMEAGEEAILREKARRWIRLHPGNDNPPEKLRKAVKKLEKRRKS